MLRQVESLHDIMLSPKHITVKTHFRLYSEAFFIWVRDEIKLPRAGLHKSPGWLSGPLPTGLNPQPPDSDK